MTNMINEHDLEAFEYYDRQWMKDPRNQTPLEMVREFAEAMDQPLDQPFSDTTLINLRYRLIDEEVLEATEAGEESLPKDELLKELADIVYVVYGFAATFGWNLDEAVRRVHDSNMSKLYPDGKPRYRDDGKVLKSPSYEAPDLKDLV